MGLLDFWKKKGSGGNEPPELDRWIAQLGNADPAVRLAACRALAAAGPSAMRALEHLQELLVDEDGDVCNAAAAAMSEIER